jgi:SAM-dependent methyltransferase
VTSEGPLTSGPSPASAESPATERTDWDAYYRQPFAATSVTRRISGRLLVGLMRRHAKPSAGGLTLVELGGANSCFFDRIMEQVHPVEYHVADFNQFGLDRMRERLGPRADVMLYQQDVLNLDLRLQADLVFSIGLIEHFTPADTAKAIAAHFDLARPGGVVIISFPTPTLLYRACRGAAEMLGMWKFPDERPLMRDEVLPVFRRFGDVLEEKLNWPIVLTQRYVVARKHGAPT